MPLNGQTINLAYVCQIFQLKVFPAAASHISRWLTKLFMSFSWDRDPI